jgi:hypothetical protein
VIWAESMVILIKRSSASVPSPGGRRAGQNIYSREEFFRLNN